jgi:DNA polymerase III delta subunit
MYVLFFGDNRALIRDEASAYISRGLPEGKTYHTIDTDNFEPGMVADAVGATSLFGETEWYLIDEPSQDEEFGAEVERSLEMLGDSPNQFVIIEAKLTASKRKLYEQYASDSKELSVEKTTKLNPFQMAEALAQKDKRRLWVLLQEAKMSGMREEEIIGILWWQLKTLRLATITSTAQEAGMKDFPYNKAKQALGKFNRGEIEALSSSLLKVYHDGHAGVRPIDLGLERWALTI